MSFRLTFKLDVSTSDAPLALTRAQSHRPW